MKRPVWRCVCGWGNGMLSAGLVCALAWLWLEYKPTAGGQANSEQLQIVFEDSKVRWWSPTAGAWRGGYGDFYAYGYHALLERVADMYGSAEVITTEVTEERLLRCDVLVIKIPEAPYEKAEIECIERWVRNGGRLIVMGDHTNLLGHTDILNELVGFAGLRFQRDHAADAGGGGVVVARSEWTGRDIHVLSACTIRGAGKTLWKLPDAHVVPWDMVGQSGFASENQTPNTRTGMASLAKIRQVGRGCVVACGDTTMFSSFALHKHGRFAAFRELVEAGTGARYGDAGIATWIGVIGLLFWGSRRGRARVAGLAMGAVGAAILWGVFGTRDQTARMEPEKGAWGVAAVGAETFIPNTIGGSRVEQDDSVDGLLYAHVRAGLKIQALQEAAPTEGKVLIVRQGGESAWGVRSAREGRRTIGWCDGVSVWADIQREVDVGGGTWGRRREWRGRAGELRGWLQEAQWEGGGTCVWGCIVAGITDSTFMTPLAVPSGRQELELEMVDAAVGWATEEVGR